MNEHTALMVPAQTDLETLFSIDKGLDPVIAAIRAEALAHVPDISTKKGRDAIASMAYKVSRSKTALDEAGKSLTEDAQKQINTVNAERKKMRDELDALRDQVRKPLVDWELAEKERVDGLKERLAGLEAAAPAEETSACIKALTQRVEAVELDDSWAEYKAHAAVAKDTKLTELRKLLAATEQREAEQAELARLREEQAKRDEEDRLRREAEEAEARRVAAEKAEAERLAQIEREKAAAVEQARIAAEAKAAEEAERAARAAKEREDRLQREAEAAKRAALEAEQRRLRAAEEAKAREAAAAQAERDRIAAERAAEEEARRKREADQAHRSKIRAEIIAALEAMRGNATPDAIADALMAGQIPHCEVTL